MKRIKFKVMGIGLVASMLLSTNMIFASESSQVNNYNGKTTRIKTIGHIGLDEKHSISQEMIEEFKNMTPEQRKELHLTQLKERLTQSVEDGKITQEKADEMYEKATNSDFSKDMVIGIRVKEFGEMNDEFKNMTPEQRKELHLTQLKERLAQAVADGKITQEKADEMYEKATNSDFSKDMGIDMKVKKFGETNEKFKNMTPEQRKESHLTQLKERLAQAVADGKITQEKADEMYEKAANSDFSKGMEKGMKIKLMWNKDGEFHLIDSSIPQA